MTPRDLVLPETTDVRMSRARIQVRCLLACEIGVDDSAAVRRTELIQCLSLAYKLLIQLRSG